jgi:hypothetical protein
VTTKYESPYANDPPQFDAPPSPLKRRASQDVFMEGDEKRQRIEIEEQLGNDDLARIIAQATATATQSIADSTNMDLFNPSIEQMAQDFANQAAESFNEQPPEPPVEQPVTEMSPGFSSDPHLYMRILSLPILESLVRLQRCDIVACCVNLTS